MDSTPGIYIFYVTTDPNVVRTSPSVYDRLLVENNLVMWVRTERFDSPQRIDVATPLEQAALDNEPRPGEQFLGVVEV